MKKHQLLLGAHISIAGGVQNALYKGASIGCTAVQFFTHSNRQWSFKTFNQSDIDAFNLAKNETHITHILAHASYLINLASTSQDIRQKALLGLKSEIARCKQLGIKYLVLHPGSGSAPEQAFEYVIEGINEALKEETDVEILLELMAGQGTSIGSTFEELAILRKGIDKKELIGICFDTCHAWAAGYVFNTPESYKAMWEYFDSVIGLKHLKALHLNDSVKNPGTHVDRHAHIAKGTIGAETFRLILNDENFFNIPKIIETPKEKDRELEDDTVNLELLKSLISSKNRKELHM